MFGAMSFVEKVVGGVALMLIQKEMPNPIKEDDGRFFVSIVAYGCGGVALFGILVQIALYPFKLGQR